MRVVNMQRMGEAAAFTDRSFFCGRAQNRQISLAVFLCMQQ